MIKITGSDICNAIDYRVARLKLALDGAMSRGDFELASQILEQITEAHTSRKEVSGTIPSQILYDVEIKEGKRLGEGLF